MNTDRKCNHFVEHPDGWRRCERNATVLEDGAEFCRQHAPSVVETRRAVQRLRAVRRNAADARKWRRQTAGVRLLELVERLDEEIRDRTVGRDGPEEHRRARLLESFLTDARAVIGKIDGPDVP